MADLSSPLYGFCGAFLSLGQLADLTTTITSLVVVAGIVFAWLQYRGTRDEYRRQVEDSRVELLTGMTMYLNEVARVFVEYPEMKKYFHDGQRPGQLDRPRAEAIAVTLANAMDHVCAHLDIAETLDRGAWEAYFDHVYENSPTLRQYLQEHGAWYGPKLRKRFRLRPR